MRANVRFMREHADHPVNFCRAEPYHGTPLYEDLAARGTLSGSHLGWDYRMEDPRAELLFRVVAAAFRQRNFDSDGVANRYMGLGYSAKLLEFFHDDPKVAALARRARELTRGVALETADLLEEAIALASRVDPGDHDTVERETALLGLKVAAADRGWHVLLDALYADMGEHARRAQRPRRRPAVPRALARAAQQMAMGASIALWATGVAGCAGNVVDPVPQDAGRADLQVVDPPPPDAGRDATPDRWVVDPAPLDAGRDVINPEDRWVVDPAPQDAGMPDIVPVDPPPPDAGVEDVPRIVDPPPPDAGRRDAMRLPRKGLPLIDQWRDTAPRRSLRDTAVALHAPPDASLSTSREDDRVTVRVEGIVGAASARWEGDGLIEGDGLSARWTPVDPDDQLRVALRIRGGVAVLALRASDVDRRARAVAEIRDEG